MVQCHFLTYKLVSLVFSASSYIYGSNWKYKRRTKYREVSLLMVQCQFLTDKLVSLWGQLEYKSGTK